MAKPNGAIRTDCHPHAPWINTTRCYTQTTSAKTIWMNLLGKIMSEVLYTPAVGEKQLTLRALLAGCLLGSIVSMINIYLGLQTGWMAAASLITAILGYAILKPLCSNYSILENNITATAGCAAGGMSSALGCTTMIPALDMLDHPMSITTLYIWGFCVALIGIFYIVPLRKQFLLIDKLRFPTATATAETIVLMHQTGRDNSASILLKYALIGGLISLSSYFMPSLKHIDIFATLGVTAISVWGFSVLTSPMMFGIGMIAGLRVALSFFIGAVIAWGLIAPVITHLHWVNSDLHDYKLGAQGWLLWPGITLMTVDALLIFLFNIPAMLKPTLKPQLTTLNNDIPKKAWISGLILTACASFICLTVCFHLGVLVSIVVIVLSALLAAMATRAQGETDINPVSAVSKVTQLTFTGIASGHAVDNLLGAGFTGAAAHSAADTMASLKTGLMLGASPKLQFLTQCIGAVVGIIFSVPLYFLFKAAYTIGGPSLPAPTAQAWKACAEVLTQGLSTLPAHSLTAVGAAAVLAVLMNLLSRNPRWKHYMPSNTAMGIAFIIPAYYAVIFFLGALVYQLWHRVQPQLASRGLFPVASGLIIGEGLMGIVKACLILLGVQPLWP
jgi:uncharacterized oligopeptide transporter (OPT) family protein